MGGQKTPLRFLRIFPKVVFGKAGEGLIGGNPGGIFF
jgi:hypothetical protein